MFERDSTTPVLATCEAELLEVWLLTEPEPPAELGPPELWLLTELPDDDELELAELLCDAPEFGELLELTELLEVLLEGLLELDPLATPEVCCPKRVGTERINVMTRPESLIKHLLTNPCKLDKIFVVLLHSDANRALSGYPQTASTNVVIE